MNYQISPFIARGIIDSVPSKSYAHRAIILSALSKGWTKINNIGSSDDVKVTLACVQKLGATVKEFEGGVEILGIENLPNEVSLDFGESGSTMRFLIPLCLALGVKTNFTGRGKLLSRPNDALYNTLTKMGAKIDGQTLTNKLKAGVYEIDATVSSQYISGLLMSLPYLEGTSEIRLLGQTVSKDYITMTLELLRLFKVQYEIKDNSIFVGGGYVSPKELTVEGDWSSAAFPLALGAIGGEVTVKGLNINSSQGDKQIVEILKNLGAKVSVSKGEITLKKGELTGAIIDVANIPDVAPCLSTVLAFADGKSVLKNVDRLKIKESDRLSAIIQNLTVAGIKTEYVDNTLIIYGGSVLGGTYGGFNDHRMVMSACVLASMADKSSTVTDVNAVAKSYPEFFDDFLKLGGNYRVVI